MNSTPYSQLAQIYDKVMAHVNYKMWAEYIKRLYHFTDSKIDRTVDLSCGTGKHISFLSHKRGSFIGADYSQQMIFVARSNLSQKRQTLLFVNDARYIALKTQSVNIVLMLYDSVNYLLEDSDVINLFSEVCRILAPGGIFIFDFVTESGLEECFDGYYETDSWDGIAYERQSQYSKKEKIQYNKFNFLFNGEPFFEEHIQRIRTSEEWKDFIAKSKMHLSGEFSNFSMSAPNRQSKRIHFVCKKEQT